MQKITDYIYNIPKLSKKCSLDNTREMLRRLGNPEKHGRIIHVAGTNGKGSVCAYLNGILQAAGFTTGLFTSPHLIRMNERIKINGQDVSDDIFTAAYNKVLSVSTAMVEDGFSHPSFFEFLFGMAMYIFGLNNVDYIILETGLGGRLDATNAINNPVLSVITSIGLDHTELLGDTYEKIAAEKAGIIKAGVPVIFEDLRAGVTAVIRSKAEETGAPVKFFAKKDIVNIIKKDKYIDFSFHNGYYDNEIFTIVTNGIYQTENAALAIMAANELGVNDADIIRNGIKNVRWAGRMQEIDDNMILDGAHNEAGIERFIESVGQDGFSGDRYLIFSAVKDKHYDTMIKKLCESGLFKGYILVPLTDDRGLDKDTMTSVFKQFTDAEVMPMDNISQGVFQACMLRDSGSRIYMAGSLYLAGEILALRE